MIVNECQSPERCAAKDALDPRFQGFLLVCAADFGTSQQIAHRPVDQFTFASDDIMIAQQLDFGLVAASLAQLAHVRADEELDASLCGQCDSPDAQKYQRDGEDPAGGGGRDQVAVADGPQGDDGQPDGISHRQVFQNHVAQGPNGEDDREKNERVAYLALGLCQ